MNRGHGIITISGACAAIAIGAAPISWANAPSGRSLRGTATHHPKHAPALTKKQIRDLVEIQQGAIEAGLHPGVFGPPAANFPPVPPRAVTHAESSDWGATGTEAAGAFALTLIACGGGLIAIRRRNHRIPNQPATDQSRQPYLGFTGQPSNQSTRRAFREGPAEKSGS